MLERNGAPVRLPRVGDTTQRCRSRCEFAADNTLSHGDIGGECRAQFRHGHRYAVALHVQSSHAVPAEAQRRSCCALSCSATPGRKLSAAIANAIIKVSRVARTEADSGELRGAPGLRACVAMGILIVCGETAESAYECAVTLGAPPESWEKLRGCFATHWPNAAELAAAANFTTGN